MALLNSLGLPPPPAKAIKPMPVMDVTASKGVEVRANGAKAVPVKDADPAAAARELRDALAAREKKVRANYTPAAAAVVAIETKIAAAEGPKKAEIQATKKKLEAYVAGCQRELGQIDKDRKALDDPRTSRETFVQILARAKSPVEVGKLTEVDRHDNVFEKSKLTDKTTTTTSAYDGKTAKTSTHVKSEKLGLIDGYVGEDKKTRTATLASGGVASVEQNRKTTVDWKGVGVESGTKVQYEKDGKTGSVETKKATQVGPGGASTTTTKTNVERDGSEQSKATTTGVERNDGKLGAKRSQTATKTDVDGNETTKTTTHKGGVIAGKDGVGAYADTEKKVERQGANGLKLGAVGGLSPSVLCNVAAVKDSNPAKYEVSLRIDLGARLGGSIGYDKKPGKGQADEQTRVTASGGINASGNVYATRSRTLGEAETQAYLAAVKSGSGSQPEFAILRCVLAGDLAAAQRLHFGSTKVTDKATTDQLQEGESLEVGKSGTVGVDGSVGVKGGGIGAGISAGHERGHEESLKVTKKGGGLEYDAKIGDSSKTSGGANVNAGIVEGSFGQSRAHTTSTGYKIVIAPGMAGAAEMQQALDACKNQKDLDAFAAKYPKAVQEKSKGKGQADKTTAGVGIGAAKLGMNFGKNIDENVVTDGDGKLKEKTVTGGSEGGMEVGIGDYKVGASSKQKATAKIDGDGNATLELDKTDKSTNATKWLGAKVPFAGDKKEGGLLTKATGGAAKEDTDDTTVTGTDLRGDDLKYLGWLACNDWSRWMKACTRPDELKDWASAGRRIQAADGKVSVVAEQLARFAGKDEAGRNQVIDDALRLKAGDMSGGSRHQFPGGLASRKASYQALVVADAEASITSAEAGQKMVADLTSLWNAVSSTEGFTDSKVKAEMLSSINARKEKVLAKLRVMAGGKADELSFKEKVDKYNALLSNCQRYKDSESKIFKKIDDSFKGTFASSKGDVVGNVKLVNELRGMYTLWDKEYDEMAALAQENKFGDGVYWKYKPDRDRFDKAYKGVRPGEAAEAKPETADKRKKPAAKPAEPVSADPVGDSARGLEKIQAERVKTWPGRIAEAKTKALGAGNRLHAWIQHERKAAAVTAHNDGAVKLKSAKGWESRVKPQDPMSVDGEGAMAIEDYTAATNAYGRGLALYPKGMPPKKDAVAAA